MSEMIEAAAQTLTGQALEYAVALALGYKKVRVPADIDGENSGEVLAPPDLSSDFDWPRRGRVAETYFLARWASDWMRGGPLIKQFNIMLGPPNKPVHVYGGPNHGWQPSGHWSACTFEAGASGKRAFAWHETEPLIAAMRCLVEFKLGKSVNVPTILLKDGAT